MRSISLLFSCLYWASCAQAVKGEPGPAGVAGPAGPPGLVGPIGPAGPPGSRQGDSLAVNVRDFGTAVGSGGDDSEAFQRALDTGRTVFMPAGTYIVSRTLHSTGANSGTGPRLIGAGTATTTIVTRVRQGPTFRFARDRDGGVGGYYQFAYGGRAEDFTLRGQGDVGADGFWLSNQWGFEFKDVTVDGVSGHALYFANRTDFVPTAAEFAAPDGGSNADGFTTLGSAVRLRAIRAGGYGFLNEASVAGVLTCQDCDFVANTRGGIRTSGGLNLRGGAVAYNRGPGLVVEAFAAGGQSAFVPQNVVIREGVEFDANEGVNLWFKDVDGFLVEYSRFISNAVAGLPTTPVHVRFGGGSGNVALRGRVSNTFHRVDFTSGSYRLFEGAPGVSAAGTSIEDFRFGTLGAAVVPFTGLQTAALLRGADGLTVQTIARRASVTARLLATTSLPGGVRTRVPFDSAAVDTHSALVRTGPQTGSYVAPYAGVYDVSVAVTLAGLPNSGSVSLSLEQNQAGTVFRIREATFATHGLPRETFTLTTAVRAAAGDVISIEVLPSAAAQMQGGEAPHWFSTRAQE
jgi:hypothetical protein